jgi:Zn-dependent protease with chaperone function
VTPFATGLIASAVVLGGLAGAVIDRARWPTAHPGTAIICWLGVLTGTVAALTGLLIVVLLTPPAPAHGLLEWLDHCLPRHGHPGVVPAAAVNLTLVTLCCLRLWHGLPRLWRAVFHRRRHREMLQMVANADERHPDVLVVDHPIPVAYCLPARHRPIVVSTGAQQRLAPPELAAVLAHERAHLRQRHHLLLLLLDLTCILLGWLPTVRRAHRSLPPLLEMAADDAAARRCGRHALATALRQLKVLAGPTGILAAAAQQGGGLTRRLARLDTSTAGVHPGARVLAWIAAFGTATGPLIIAFLAFMAIPLSC